MCSIMKMQNLIFALNSKKDSYYLSNGEYETRSHILYKNANKVQVPSKKNKGKCIQSINKNALQLSDTDYDVNR